MTHLKEEVKEVTHSNEELLIKDDLLCKLKRGKDNVTKKITNGIIITSFIILPKHVLETYINLGVYTLVNKLQNHTIKLTTESEEKLKRIFKIYISEEILLFSSQTLDLLWPEEKLNKEITFYNGSKLTLREAIADRKFFYPHIREIISILINELPGFAKFKLGISNKKKFFKFKHELTDTILYTK